MIMTFKIIEFYVKFGITHVYARLHVVLLQFVKYALHKFNEEFIYRCSGPQS